MILKVYKNRKTNFLLTSRKIVFFLVMLLAFQIGYSQEEDDDVEIVAHKVALGETVLMIAKKYLVTPTEIYRLNKKAIDGVSAGMVLYIPQPITSQEIITQRKEKREKEKLALQERIKVREERENEIRVARELLEAKEKEKELLASASNNEDSNDPNYGRREAISKLSVSDKDSFIDHHVASGETLSNLSKKYGVSIQEIEKANEKELANGLLAESTLRIPVAKNLFISKEPKQVISSISSDGTNSGPVTEIMHKVVLGETLYSISKKYGTTVNEITSLNEGKLKSGLQAGQLLKINTKVPVVVNEEIAEKSTESVITPVEETTPVELVTIKHQVLLKETLYSISKKYNVSVEDIREQNEALLTKGLQTGQELSIKVKK